MKVNPIRNLVHAVAVALPCLAAVSLGQAPKQIDPQGMARVPYAPHLILRLLPGYSPAPLAAATGSRVVYSDLQLGLHLLAAPSGVSADQVEALATAIKGFPTVIYAEADEPSDPPEVADCGPGGTTVGAQQCTIAIIDGAPLPGTFGDQYAEAAIQADAAHAAAIGVPLTVAVVDTGVEYNHQLLAPHLLPGLDMFGGGALPTGSDVADHLDNDHDGLIDEGHGHGSHVSGLVLLADPAAQILPVRVLDSDGNGSAFIVALGIYAAVDAHAQVVNLSLSSRTDCEAIAEALMYAEYEGVTVVTSAGNTGAEPLFPASYHVEDFKQIKPTWLPAGVVLTGDNLIAVGAVDKQLHKAPFSCYGPDLDLCAPGVGVYSAQANGSMAWWSGTSMSSGIASGSVSFLLSVWEEGSYPGTAAELLQETAAGLDAANPAYAGGLGAGLIHLADAVEHLLGQ